LEVPTLAQDKRRVGIFICCKNKKVEDIMEKRLGFVGIIIQDRRKTAPRVNEILTEYGDIIVARMGLPYHERNCCVITIIVDATTDEFGALTGKLGLVEGVSVRSALSKTSY
jgi:putative iron-only hydrogenase system regulator